MTTRMNFSRFINHVSAARKESPIREATAIVLKNPQILSLGAGWPNPRLFPFKSAELTTYDGTRISFTGKKMESALQYSASQGVSNLLKWVTILHEKYHSPPILKRSLEEGGFDAVITSGSQDGLAKIFDMVANAGDNILLDDPCYSGTLAMLKPEGYNLLPVATDHHGMRSDSLLEIMKKWKPEDALDPKSTIPKVLYTIPTCGNPTGATASLERKKNIYKIAQDYDLLIVEDDPYFYLQSGKPVPSYQSIDVDGRVLRSDSMSKVMSSGLRIGWITGAQPFIHRLVLHQQANVLQANTFGQTAISALLDQWGLEGFESHVENVQKFYKSQRDAMLRCMNKWMKGLAEWNEPQGGMFLWIKLNGVDDTTELIKKVAVKKDILLLPGSAFNVDEKKKSSYCRASYSFATEDTMNEICQKLAEFLKEELNVK